MEPWGNEAAKPSLPDNTSRIRLQPQTKSFLKSARDCSGGYFPKSQATVPPNIETLHSTTVDEKTCISHNKEYTIIPMV